MHFGHIQKMSCYLQYLIMIPHLNKLLFQKSFKQGKSLDTCQSDVRKFIPPKINFCAPNYFTLIEDDAIIAPPPLLSEFTDEQLIASFISPINIPLLPCHTQAVERGVKVVTQASESVYGYEARHSYILNTIKSRESYKHSFKKRFYMLTIISCYLDTSFSSN